MKCRTHIDIPVNDLLINHKTEILLFGSCFSENIGQKMIMSKFKVDVNPFGILYNPSSVAASVSRLIMDKPFNSDELAFRDGLWHSFMHHGSFSDVDKESCLERINTRYKGAAEKINRADLLLITFGTAYVYRLQSNEQLVSNCHKFPDCLFSRSRLFVEEIVSEWTNIIEQLLSINPSIKIVLTVSPIRHMKDGAHNNQLSKAILHLAIDELVNRFGNIVFYFPSYEIVMDELRDYRFYTADMNHLTDVAIDYIWERFSKTFFDEKTEQIIRSWNEIARALQHRPIYISSDQFNQFQIQTLNKIEQFRKLYPFINCDQEYNSLVNTIK